MPDSNLPDSWLRCELGEVIKYGAGKAASPAEFDQDQWLLELEDIESNTSKILQRLTVGDRSPKSSKNKFKCGDVLYGKLRPYLNKVVIADQEGLCTTEIIPISPEELDGRYLFYWLKSSEFIAYVNSVSHGMRMPRLGTKQAKAAPVVLAPRAEQTRIANKLDELLAQVDTIKARVDAIPGILKRFRQSVLAAAVSGRLTEEWRGVAEFGEKVSLGEIACEIRYGTAKKCGYDLGKTAVIRIPNISDGAIDLSDCKSADFSDQEIQKLRLQAGDLLLIRSNGSLDLVGKAAIIDSAHEGCLYAGYLIRVRIANLDKVNPKYVLYVLLSPEMRTTIELKARSTSGVNNINSKELAALTFRLPSYEEQCLIVERLESLLGLGNQILTQVDAGGLRVNNLTQSILAKAFCGELVPQDPDEEPASVLLERIQGRRK